MPKLILEKTEHFDRQLNEHYKNQLEGILGKEFEDIKDLREEFERLGVSGLLRIPKERNVEIDSLPFTIREWPLRYGDSFYNTYNVAKIKVVE